MVVGASLIVWAARGLAEVVAGVVQRGRHVAVDGCGCGMCNNAHPSLVIDLELHSRMVMEVFSGQK